MKKVILHIESHWFVSFSFFFKPINYKLPFHMGVHSFQCWKSTLKFLFVSTGNLQTHDLQTWNLFEVGKQSKWAPFFGKEELTLYRTEAVSWTISEKLTVSYCYYLCEVTSKKEDAFVRTLGTITFRLISCKPQIQEKIKEKICNFNHDYNIGQKNYRYFPQVSQTICFCSVHYQFQDVWATLNVKN